MQSRVIWHDGLMRGPNANLLIGAIPAHVPGARDVEPELSNPETFELHIKFVRAHGAVRGATTISASGAPVTRAGTPSRASNGEIVA